MPNLPVSTNRNSIVADVFPQFTKPLVCGYFSIGPKREYQSGSDHLLYYFGNLLEITRKKQNVSYDLNHFYDEATKKLPLLSLTEKIDCMLHYLLSNMERHREKSGRRLFNAEIIVFRGLLRMLMCTPFNDDGWIVCASYFRGNIYLCAVPTAKDIHEERNAPEKQRRCCSWGYKFEQYLLTNDPSKSPDLSLPVNENEEFCCMFTSDLNGKRILYGAEMDGLISNTKITDVNVDILNRRKFVELKTNRKMNARQRSQPTSFYRYKTLKWWSQSFLVGIEDIICGFRDDNGIVGQLEHFSVNKLPKISMGLWDPRICMTFCDDFLTAVTNVVKNDTKNASFSSETVWKFVKEDGQFNISYERIDGPSEYSFLRDWFVSSINAGEVDANVKN